MNMNLAIWLFGSLLTFCTMISVQVVSVATRDSAPCIAIFSENKRILIDAGEGTQRLAIEQRVRLNRLDSICLTQLSPVVLGGLPGMCLTAADTGLRSARIYGPIGLKEFWASTKSFYYKPEFKLSLNEVPCGLDDIDGGFPGTGIMAGVAKSDGISVTCIGLKYGLCCYGFETASVLGKFDIKKALALNIPKGPLFMKLKRGESITLDDGRVIESRDVVGEPEVGSTVAVVGDLNQFPDCPASPSSPSFDLRLQTLISQLSTCSYFSQFYSGSDLEGRLPVLYHFSPLCVVIEPAYQAWMARFGLGTKHICLGLGACISHTSFLTSTSYSCKLNCINDKIFPRLPLKYDNCIGNSSSAGSASLSCSSDMIGLPSGTIRAYPTLQFCIAPKAKIGILTESADEFIQNAESTRAKEVNGFRETMIDKEGYDSAATNVHEQHQSICTRAASSSASSGPFDHEQSLLHGDDNHIIFLGTGSAIPCKYRNVTGIFLKMPLGSMLMDCGEGSWGQLLKVAGERREQLFQPTANAAGDYAEAEKEIDREPVEVLLSRSIKLVWISHPHADHHLGLTRLLVERLRWLGSTVAKRSPLMVIAPPSILEFIDIYASLYCEGALNGTYFGVCTRLLDPYDVIETSDEWWADSQLGSSVVGVARSVLPSGKVVHHYGIPASAANRAALKQRTTDFFTSIGLAVVKNVKVIHCIQSYGLVLESLSGWKLVYSGDTRPCPRLVEAGLGATLLIHEATFECDKLDQAKDKNHSTISEAVAVGQNMHAFRTILTHFSQRYPNLPRIPDPSVEKNHFNNVVMAFDFMHVTFRDLLWAPSLIPQLIIAFPPGEEEEGEKQGDEVIDGAPGCPCCPPTAMFCTQIKKQRIGEK